MYYLAGDIGGTKALLQLVQIHSEREPGAHHYSVVSQQRYPCQEFDSLESIINEFLSLTPSAIQHIQSASFGLPGPVSSSVVELTNLPWVVDAAQIEKSCSINCVRFVNDFYAAALGIDVLNDSELKPLYIPDKVIHSQNHVPGNRLVIGAGTGLGVAPVYYDGHSYLPQASEGGHFDFAPISDTQSLILHWLWQKWGHVSYERLLSGAGIETLYQFFQFHDIPTSYTLTSSQNLNKNKLFTAQNKQIGLDFALMGIHDSTQSLTAPEIQAAALAGDKVAEKALNEFVTIYGAFIGAAALLWNAPNGIYLAGGIGVKLIDWMHKPHFRAAYLEKGRMSKVVEQIPVYLVTNETLGLKGAMQYNLI